MSLETLQPFLTALAIGLLLGIEREWSHRKGARQAAGTRTFALLALGGAIAASFGPWVIAAGLAGAGALLVLGYARTSSADPGLTTEVAAAASYLLGCLAYQDSALAVALAVVVAGVLVSKARLHHVVRDLITDAEVEDAVKFLVIAFVVLPILPDRELGPFGALNPRRIWTLVVALTGIGWLGYLGVRLLGARRGLLFAGLAGGFVSASATTAAMGRMAREATGGSGADLVARRAALRAPLGAAVAASVATLAQLAAVLAFVNDALLARLLPALLSGGAALLVVAFVVARGSAAPSSPSAAIERPFALRPALVLAAVLTLALLVARAGAAWLGARGAVMAAGVAGLADAHAGSLAAATLAARGELTLPEGLLAIAASVGTNTVVKVVLAFGTGGKEFGGWFLLAILPGALAFAAAIVLSASG